MSKTPISPKKVAKPAKPVTPDAPPPSTERVPYKPAGKVFPLWPAKPAGETAPALEEYTGIVRGYVHGEHLHIVNVWNPSIEVFPAPADKNTGAAVIVCPGGCYSFLSYNMEGTEMAKWLNAIGVTCIVLKYRVPTRAGGVRGALPLKDAQRALSLVRSRAAEWGVDPARVGIMGFSAGAHLSATASTAPKRTYKAVDGTDKLSCRPDFAILLYPAYIFETDPENGPELFVNKKTPPAIIVQAADDSYPSESSLVYYQALRRAGVPVELHLYSTGGHGYGLRKTGYPCQTWPKNVAEWLKVNGWLQGK